MMRHVAANALSLFIVGLLLLLGLITWGQSRFAGEGPLDAPVVVVVDRGEGLASIAEKLRAAGAIEDVRVFRIGARYSGLDEGLRFGEYEIAARSSMRDILELMNQGANVARRITIPEGWTSWQVVEALRAREDLTGEINEVPPEGTLAPATYDLELGTDRNVVLERMAARQREVLEAAWAARDPDLPIASPEELLILASIVEKETGVPEERGTVASVFVNRLERGMRLQTDPTVIYGITRGEGTLGRGLTRVELTEPTPWNTYAIDGLPPTPIANPGTASIEAAANPPETEYYYFVADGTGGHAFGRTLEEHNRNVAVWRQIERERAAEAEAAAAEDAAAGAEGEAEVAN
jgi:UPF0755 protein